MKARATVLSSLLVVLAARCFAQVPVLLPEFQVNTAPSGYNYADNVAMDRDGRFVVVWDGTETGGYGTFRRPYDPLAVPESGPIPVESSTAGNQAFADIAKDASGRYVIVWWDITANKISGRRFGSDGTPLGNDFQVNTSTQGYVGYPLVASDPSGNFVVVWARDNSGYDSRGRAFDSHGAPLGDEFPINSYTTNDQVVSGVAMAPDGHFAAAWGGNGQTGPGIWGRLFELDGTPLTGDFQVNTGTLATAVRFPDVAMDAAGDFIVVWDDGALPAGFGAIGRAFTPAGAPVGPQFPISDATTIAFDTSVNSDSAGNFLVTWAAYPLPNDADGGVVGRFYASGGNPLADEFQINEVTTAYQFFPHASLAGDGSFVVTWTSGSNYTYDVKGRKSALRAQAGIGVDASIDADHPSRPGAAANGVLEPGETVSVATAWVNDSADPVTLNGTASNFTGPAGATYTLNDGAAAYGTIAGGQSAVCVDCYSVTVSAPSPRPAPHWDAHFLELLDIGVPRTWTLHVGESFPDAPTDNQFYRFIETLFHNGVTGGCTGGNYCPGDPVTRAQMAVFLLKSKYGSAHVPPPCTGSVFVDVPCTGGPFDPWIEELSGLGITGGCQASPPQYCPGNTVTRQQMAVFLLKAFEGSSYDPPDCAGIFDDVPCTPGTGFSDWIEELYNRQITGGCSQIPLNYCPTNPNNRGQMAVFLTKTFGLQLY